MVRVRWDEGDCSHVDIWALAQRGCAGAHEALLALAQASSLSSLSGPRSSPEVISEETAAQQQQPRSAAAAAPAFPHAFEH